MTRRAGVIIALVWLASLLLWIHPGMLLPDGAGHYAYLPSTYFDHDLVFFDEWQRFGLIRGGRILFKDVTPTGHLSNHWTIGPAMLWYPAFVLGDGIRIAAPSMKQFARDGVTLPYGIAVVVTSAFAGLAALLIGAVVAARLFGGRAAVIAAIGTWFGSPLIWYSLKHSTMSHAAAAAACALVVLLSLRLRERITLERMFSVGLALGFAAAVRPQNAVFVLVPFLLVSREQLLHMIRCTPVLAAGGLLTSLPQLIVSVALYGKPFAFVNVGGTGNRWHALERMWIWEPLFSSYHGMFVWTPLLAVAIVGFVLLRRADRGLGNAAIAMFLMQWAINSLLDRTFWGGASFGQRRFDNCTAFFLLGLAAVAARLPGWASVAITAIGSAWTMSLFFAAGRLDLNEYQTIAELVTAQRQAFESLHFALLSFVPPAMRARVLLVIFATLVFLAVIAVAMRFMTPAARSALAAAYCLSLAIVVALCARNDAAHLEAWMPFIDQQKHVRPSGAAAEELNALAHEYRYLQRTGRTVEASRTRADWEALAKRVR